MKLVYGNVPVKSLNLNYFERNTNDCDMIASDLQAGKTAVARGEKITGTGKSFEFARYGEFTTNQTDYIPTNINTILISSSDVPLKFEGSLDAMKNQDFTTSTMVGSILVDNVFYPVYVAVDGNFISTTCEKTVLLQVFFGKDNYV
jgi:hypothetical protein